MVNSAQPTIFFRIGGWFRFALPVRPGSSACETCDGWLDGGFQIGELRRVAKAKRAHHSRSRTWMEGGHDANAPLPTPRSRSHVVAIGNSVSGSKKCSGPGCAETRT